MTTEENKHCLKICVNGVISIYKISPRKVNTSISVNKNIVAEIFSY